MTEIDAALRRRPTRECLPPQHKSAGRFWAELEEPSFYESLWSVILSARKSSELPAKGKDKCQVTTSDGN